MGPGSIDQAHQPDEYISVAQLEQGSDFIRRLIRRQLDGLGLTEGVGYWCVA